MRRGHVGMTEHPRADRGPGGRGGLATTVGVAKAEAADIPVVLDLTLSGPSGEDIAGGRVRVPGRTEERSGVDGCGGGIGVAGTACR